MRFLLLPLLLLATAAAYWPGLAGGFVFDDLGNIINNPSLRVFDGTPSGLLAAASGGVASPLGRPLSMASFAANLHFWGEAPFSFKLVNLLIHLANGLLVYVLVRQLWPRLVGDGRAAVAALWVAAFWMLHPLNLTAVLFVVQRMTSLSALFTLAALCLYLLGLTSSGPRRWTAFAIAFLACWPAGVLAKETALLLPLFILVTEWLGFADRPALPERWRLAGACMLLAGAATLLLLAWPMVEQSYRLRDFTMGERLLTEARVLWLYIGQLLAPWPDNFSLHHDDIAISHGWFAPPETALAIVGLLAVAAIAYRQRRRQPWLAFAVFWFLAGHVLESGLLGLEIAYEHRNYLPSLGIILGLAAVLLPAPTVGAGRVPRLTLAWSLVIFCALVTWLRAEQWGDEFVRTQIEANTHSQSARTHHDAAQAILARELPTGAIRQSAYFMARVHLQRAAQLDAHNKAALAGILYLDCAMHSRPDAAVREELLRRLTQQRFTFGDQGFVQGLSDQLVYGLFCLDEQETETLLAAALSNPMADGQMRGLLHAVAMDYAAARLGSLPRARVHAEAAVAADPGNAVLHINLIRVQQQQGDTAASRRQYAVLRGLRVPAHVRREVEDLGRRLDN